MSKEVGMEILKSILVFHSLVSGTSWGLCVHHSIYAVELFCCYKEEERLTTECRVVRIIPKEITQIG